MVLIEIYSGVLVNVLQTCHSDMMDHHFLVSRHLTLNINGKNTKSYKNLLHVSTLTRIFDTICNTIVTMCVVVHFIAW